MTRRGPPSSGGITSAIFGTQPGPQVPPSAVVSVSTVSNMTIGRVVLTHLVAPVAFFSFADASGAVTTVGAGGSGQLLTDAESYYGFGQQVGVPLSQPQAITGVFGSFGGGSGGVFASSEDTSYTATSSTVSLGRLGFIFSQPVSNVQLTNVQCVACCQHTPVTLW